MARLDPQWLAEAVGREIDRRDRASPALAVGQERHRSGRAGVRDIALANQNGQTIALVHGNSFRLPGHILESPPH